MMSRICLVLLLSVSCSLFAQVPIRAELKQADEIRSSDPQQFIALLDAVAPASLNHDEQVLYQYLIAYKHALIGQYDTAISQLRRLLSTDITPTIRMRALANLLNVYALQRQWSQGYPVIDSIMAIPADQVDKARVNTAYVTVLMFYNAIGDFQSALDFAQQHLQHSESLRVNCIVQQESLRSLVKGARNQSAPPVSEAYAQAFARCQQAKEPIFTGLSSVIAAEYHIDRQAYSEAIELLQDNMSQANASNYAVLQAFLYSTLAKAYHLNQQTSLALDYASLTLNYLQQIKDTGILVNVYQVLYEIAEAEGRYQQALDYHQKFAQASQVFWDEEKAKQLAIQQAKHLNHQKEAKIALLTTQNALANEQVQNDRLAMALIALTCFALLLWAYKHRSAAIKLKVKAEQDELTGIANRYYFNQQAEAALAFCKKQQQPVAYILFDLDHFKQVNDNYGHPTGDWVLCEAVKSALKACRSNDLIGRLGGEEFAILLPNSTLQQASYLAEKCRKAIAETETEGSGYQFSITASFGLTDSERCGYQLDKLYACADAALYCSKDAGRNRICLFEKGMSVP